MAYNFIIFTSEKKIINDSNLKLWLLMNVQNVEWLLTQLAPSATFP
jgi:hypothetical protein